MNPNFDHVIILADESANWKIAGLCQLERLVLARDDGLQGSHKVRRHHDRIDGPMRRGPVAALAVENDVDRIRSGGSRP